MSIRSPIGTPEGLLSRERERELFRNVKEGGPKAQAARDEIILAYRPLVYAFASKYRRGSIPFEDLVGIATLALIEVLPRYDLKMKKRFACLAESAIRNSFFKAFAQDGIGCVSIPKDLYQALFMVRCNPGKDLGEIARSFRMSRDELEMFIHRSQGKIALDDQAHESEDGDRSTFGESLCRGCPVSMDDTARLAAWQAKFDELSYEEKIIVRHIYDKDHTPGTVRALGIASRKVKAIGDEALRKLGVTPPNKIREESLDRLIVLWRETFGDSPVTATEVLPVARTAGIPIKGMTRQSQCSGIARMLRFQQGVVRNGYRIAPAGELRTAHGGPPRKLWKLEPVEAVLALRGA